MLREPDTFWVVIVKYPKCATRTRHTVGTQGLQLHECRIVKESGRCQTVLAKVPVAKLSEHPTVHIGSCSVFV